MNATLTAIAGLSVGHWSDPVARTGCTVVVCPPDGCLGSGLVLGPNPGSRESALLEPDRSVNVVHAVVLTGGSAFGLDAAGGVVGWLEAQGRGFPTPFARVPIVPAAVIYDLGVGSAAVRPTAAAGLAAATAATTAPVAMGAVGVGAGATVGRYRGWPAATPSGLGSALLELEGVRVGALAVSNAVGDIVDPSNGGLVAGLGAAPLEVAAAFAAPPAGVNTTLALVATDALLTKSEARALAQSAHIGIARVTRPSHTVYDGDTAFVLSTGAGAPAPLGVLSVLVQEAVAAAILAGVRATAGG